MAVFLIFAVSAIGVVADLFMKWAGQGKETDWRWLTAGIILYALTLPGVYFAIKFVKLSLFGAVYSVSSILLLVAVGYLYCHEKLTIWEIAGVCTSVLSLFLLSRFASA